MKNANDVLIKSLGICCLVLLLIVSIRIETLETKFQSMLTSVEQHFENRRTEIEINYQVYKLENVKSELQRVEEFYFTYEDEINEYCNQRDSSLCEYVMNLEIKPIINLSLKIVTLTILMDGIESKNDESEITRKTQLKHIRDLVGYYEQRRDEIYKEIEVVIASIGTKTNTSKRWNYLNQNESQFLNEKEYTKRVKMFIDAEILISKFQVSELSLDERIRFSEQAKDIMDNSGYSLTDKMQLGFLFRMESSERM